MPQIVLNALLKYFANNPQVVEKLIEQLIPGLVDLIVAEVNKAVDAAKTAK